MLSNDMCKILFLPVSKTSIFFSFFFKDKNSGCLKFCHLPIIIIIIFYYARSHCHTPGTGDEKTHQRDFPPTPLRCCWGRNQRVWSEEIPRSFPPAAPPVALSTGRRDGAIRAGGGGKTQIGSKGKDRRSRI